MGEFLPFYQYIFSSFWIWLGTCMLVCAVVSILVGFIKLVRG